MPDDNEVAFEAWLDPETGNMHSRFLSTAPLPPDTLGSFASRHSNCPGALMGSTHANGEWEMFCMSCGIGVEQKNV